MAEEKSLPFSGGQAVEGARAGAAAASFGQGQPSGVGQAPAPFGHGQRSGVAAASMDRVSHLTGAQGGRAGFTQGSCSMALEHAPGRFDQFMLDQIDFELSITQAAYKQLHLKSKMITYALQEKQGVERAHDDLSMKSKEMSLKMERLQCENMELSLKNKEQALEIDNLKKTLAERELVQTMSLSNGQAYEGGTSNIPQEGLFDPDQQDRFIFENHKRQLELTETRKKLKDVFTNMGHDDEDASVIGIKRLGQINEKPFYRAVCGDVKQAAKKCSLWQQKVESHTWRPFKGITEKGRYEEVLDEEDETLKELKACGQDIYDAVVEALMEMDKYNSSGRTVVPELWNFKEGRMATTVECIEFLSRKVMESKPECSKRRRTSPRFRWWW